MIIKLHRNFQKIYRKLPISLQKAVDHKMALFYQEPFSPMLNNHQLKGKYQNYRSINITGDYRAVYKTVSDKEVIFTKLGTHSQLYK